MCCVVNVVGMLLIFTSFFLTGIHLQICPRGVTCCTPEMETKLWTLSRETYTASLAATTHHLQSLFHSRSKRFDGELLWGF